MGKNDTLGGMSSTPQAIDLLSIILDALSAFEETITRGDHDWPSYPTTGDDPEETLRQYVEDIHHAAAVVSALMPGPRLSAKTRAEMRAFLAQAKSEARDE
jgi:hypothetical protein